MKIGILGAGGIAAKVSKTFAQMGEIDTYAVSSRSPEKAERFAAENGYEKAFGSYDAMLADPDTELVYVCTPHSEHYEHVRMCLDAGKHVVCEKAFMINASQAAELAELAKKKGLYLAEAMWPRYMPSSRIIDEIIASGIVGKPVNCSINFAQKLDHVERLINPDLAGGALLDLGVYGLNFIFSHFGWDVEEIKSEAILNKSGVDASEIVLIKFRDGCTASSYHSIMCRGDNRAVIYCEDGLISVDNVNAPQKITIMSNHRTVIREIDARADISGYEYEFREAVRLIGEGKTESESMPLRETIRILELCDKLRKDWGVVYPGEIK